MGVALQNSKQLTYHSGSSQTCFKSCRDGFHAALGVDGDQQSLGSVVVDQRGGLLAVDLETIANDRFVVVCSTPSQQSLDKDLVVEFQTEGGVVEMQRILSGARTATSLVRAAGGHVLTQAATRSACVR